MAEYILRSCLIAIQALSINMLLKYLLLRGVIPPVFSVRKTGDPKIYHKAIKSTQEIFSIKKQCEANSTNNTKYSIIKMM